MHVVFYQVPFSLISVIVALLFCEDYRFFFFKIRKNTEKELYLEMILSFFLQVCLRCF